MKIDCVLASCNEKNFYLSCIPYFISYWKLLYPEIDIKIVLVMKNLPHDLVDFSKYIILFDPIEGIKTSSIAQYIRNLYPCILDYENGILITDIDLLPISNKYFTDNISHIEDDYFVNYRSCFNPVKCKMLAIAYNIAKPSVWSDIFNINNKTDIIKRLQEKYDNRYKNWFKDQEDLYEYVYEWNMKTKRLQILDDNETKFFRLCRSDTNKNHEYIGNLSEKVIENIKNGKYTDYHMCRPFNKKINDKIYDILKTL